MNAIFSYKETKIYIQCNLEDKMLDICQKFSNKINQEVDSKIYIFMEKVLNLDSTLEEQLNISSDFKSDIKEILITIYDNDKDTVLIKYNYEGEDKQVQLKKGDNILKRISSLIKQPYEKINILYNGDTATKDDFNKDFTGLANSQNIEDNTMSLIIFNRSETIEEKNGEKDKKDENSKDKKDEKKKYMVKEVRKFLQKMYSILIIQYGCILVFGLFGFYFEINEIFIKNLGSILGTFIPITLLSLFGGFFVSLDDARKYLSKQVNYIVLSLFVPITVFYCFLLSKYVDNNYITCGIILFSTDIFCSTSYFFISKEYRGFLIFIFSLIFNIITIIIYCTLIFDEITGSKITILIFMAIIMIIYMTAFNVFLRILYNDDEFSLAALNFNYLVFFPILVLIIVIPIGLCFLIFILGALLFYGISLVCLIIYGSIMAKNLY